MKKQKASSYSRMPFARFHIFKKCVLPPRLQTSELIRKAQLQSPLFGIVCETIVGLLDIHQWWPGAEQIHSGERDIHASGHVPKKTHIPCDKRVNRAEQITNIRIIGPH